MFQHFPIKNLPSSQALLPVSLGTVNNRSLFCYRAPLSQWFIALSNASCGANTSFSFSPLSHPLANFHPTLVVSLVSLFSGRDALKTEHHSLPQAFLSVITVGLQPPMFCSHLPTSTLQSYSCFSPQRHAIDSSLCCSLAAPPSYT